MKEYDLLVVGGGPAGMAAAYEAYKNGVKKIIILERDNCLGGILNQCIHNGFGLHIFKEELTGPEYAYRFIEKIEESHIEVSLETMVLNINIEKNELNEDKVHKKIVCAVSRNGYINYKTKAVILALGCRERCRGAVNICGDRPSGIFSAGSAQKYINIEGYMPGSSVLIVGSGDIGLIMARRMALEGADVKGVVEIMPYSSGLKRNIVQCLEDFNIPLYLSHTVVDVIGNKRLEKVIIAQVDKNKKVICGSEKEFEVDTLLLSVGLICENELAYNAGIKIDEKTNSIIINEGMESSMEGVFICGNVLHVHDIVDFVTEESIKAGYYASKYINAKFKRGDYLNIKGDDKINYIVPQKVNVNNLEDSLVVFFRVNNIYHNKVIEISSGNSIISEIKKEHLIPAEMLKVSLKSSDFKEINSDINICLRDDK